MTATGIPPGNCCCPARRWRESSPLTRRSAPPPRTWWNGTAPAALQAAGALWSFSLLTAEDVELDEAEIDLDLDGVDEWAADISARLRPAGDDLPPCRRSPTSSPPSATSTSSTPTAGPRPLTC